MRRFVALTLLFAACSAPLQTGAFLEGSFRIPEELAPTGEMEYVVWFPPGFEHGDDAPVVVFLHGSGDDDYDTRWLTSYGLPAVVRFDALPSAPPFVLIAPRATPGTSWDAGGQPETVMALVDDVVTRFGLDSRPLLLTGQSMGGYGVWHVATRFPDRFDRVASISGSGYGTTAFPADLDVCALAGVDLRAYHGSEDGVSLLDSTRDVVRRWEERCDAVVDLRILEGRGHFETFESVYRDPSFYDWLLTG